jgi:hypothetical protein
VAGAGLPLSHFSRNRRPGLKRLLDFRKSRTGSRHSVFPEIQAQFPNFVVFSFFEYFQQPNGIE